MSKDIWVYAETHDGKLCDIVPELLTKGRQLKAHNGGDLVAVVLGSSDDAALRELSEYGADMVIIGENAARSSYSARTYAQAMTALAKKYSAALPYLTEQRLGVWTHNKTIQKAVESYRITPEQKEYLKTLKRKERS